MSVKEDSVHWPSLVLTIVIRLLFWSSTIWMLYLLLERRDFSIYQIHAIFSTLGCGLLMVEATLVVTGDALLTAKLSRSNRITLHWVLHLLGIITLVVGLVSIEYHKISSSISLYNSNHGKVGIVAYIVAFVVAIAAIPIVCTKLLPRIMSLASLKYFHIFAGSISLILMWAGQITSLYTAWWQGTWWDSSDLGNALTIAALVVGGFLLIAKPCFSTLSRIFGSSS